MGSLLLYGGTFARSYSVSIYRLWPENKFLGKSAGADCNQFKFGCNALSSPPCPSLSEDGYKHSRMISDLTCIHI